MRLPGPRCPGDPSACVLRPHIVPGHPIPTRRECRFARGPLARMAARRAVPIRQAMKADSFLLETQVITPVSTDSSSPGTESATAAALYSSLRLSDILRGCKELLAARFALGRLSFVQHRANDSTVTLFPTEEGGEAAPAGPKIIVLGKSRLRRCIAQRKKLIVNLRNPSDYDAVEQGHLLQPGAGCVMYLPLMLNGNMKGILVVSLLRGARPDRADHEYLDYVSQHLALAIENSDAHYLEQRRGRQLSMVSEIARQAVMVEDLDEFLGAAPEMLRRGFNYDLVQVWTMGPKQETLYLAGCAHRSTQHEATCGCTPRIVEDCVRQGQTLCNNNCLESTATDSQCCEGIASQLAVPIRMRNKPLGVLCLASKRLDAFPAEDIDIMDGVVSVIATAYDNLRAFKHAQQSKEYMQAVLESAKDQAVVSTDLSGRVMTSSAGSEPVFRLSQQEMPGKLLTDLFNNEEFRKELAAYLADPARMSFERRKLPHSGAKADSFLDVTVQRALDPENRPIGFLCLARDVTENVLLQERLEALSITDELTGLYNKRHFFAVLATEIERSRRFSHRLSLCFFDLDGLKQYNDTRGHLSGDRALKETADLLQGLVRSNVDSCYRYGGDEFTIVMPSTNKFNAQIVVERIRGKLSENFRGMITASIGIAECSDLDTAENLVEKADRAMYIAKVRGGNRVFVAE
jgi:two-component system cell cycle response regulator